jgi:hypothetical protein
MTYCVSFKIFCSVYFVSLVSSYVTLKFEIMWRLCTLIKTGTLLHFLKKLGSCYVAPNM